MHYLTVILSGSLIDLDGTIFIQFALFVLAFFILRALVFGPIVKLLEARDAAIDGAVETARTMTQEAKDAEAEFEAEMRTVRLAASAERDKLRADGKKLEASLLAKVREETQTQLDEAEKSLNREAQQVRQEMVSKTPLLARAIASKMLEREIV